VQNNVLELWSLFDFLMPGVLGDEKAFGRCYSRPVALSKDPKATAAVQERGQRALDRLHKQVLPFVMRRMKGDVLKDLPPKILNDVLCDLSPLQQRLYMDFGVAGAGAGGGGSVGGDNVDAADGEGSADVSRQPSHVFQTLQYLRKLCSHPALVLTPAHPKWLQIQAEFASRETRAAQKGAGAAAAAAAAGSGGRPDSFVHRLEHAPKLLALQQLLLDCGIGSSQQDGQEQGEVGGGGSVVSQHRVLVFAQLKSVLDIIGMRDICSFVLFWLFFFCFLPA
jgi:TATA-binding protein-associated factor